MSAKVVVSLLALGYLASQKESKVIAPTTKKKAPETTKSSGKMLYSDGKIINTVKADVHDSIPDFSGVGAFLRSQKTQKREPGVTPPSLLGVQNGELIRVKGWFELQLAAQMFAAAGVFFQNKKVEIKTAQKFRAQLAKARANIQFTDAFKVQFCKELAARLHEIRNIKTKGWVPVNHGAFADGENGYQVPSKTESELFKLLMRYDAVDYAFELAHAEAVNAGIRTVRGETNGVARILDGVAKLGAKIASGAAAGLTSGGPWGAVLGAVGSAVEGALQQAFAGVSFAAKKMEMENEFYGRLRRAMRSVDEGVGGLKTPLAEIGYAMNIPKVAIPRTFEIPAPISVFVQRSGVNLLGAWIAQGVYPGPGLHAYRRYFGGETYAWVADGDDDMGPDAWRRAPGYNAPTRSI